MGNSELYKEAMAAINRLFSDMSVSKDEARKNLEGLKDEIDLLLDSLS